MPPKPPNRAQIKGVGASSSPGGTKTIDFKIGGALGGDLGGGPRFDDDATQAALLDDLLAGDEDAHYSRDEVLQHQPTISSGGKAGPSPGGSVSGLGVKPSALAAKYGVAFDGDDSNSDSDFGPDDDNDGDNGSGNGGDNGSGNGGAAARVAAAGLSANEFGPLAAAAQENLALKAELDARRQQVRQLGVMLECLAPVPGLDAEKLLDVLEGDATFECCV